MTQEGSSQLQDYWAIELQQWIESGLSGLQYCKDNRLSYSRFTYWRKKLSIQSKPTSKARTGKSGFVQVVTRPTQELPAAEIGLTMTLPNGIVLQGIREEHVKLVGQLLRQL